MPPDPLELDEPPAPDEPPTPSSPSSDPAPGAERRGRARRWARRLLLVVASTVALAGLVVALSMTPWGRGQLARALCAWVSGEIAGSMTIEEALRFDGRTLAVRGLRFLDPHGDPTITVAQASVTARWASFLAGRVHLEAAEARGADVMIGPYDGPEGTAIEATFGAPPGVSDDEGGRPVEVLLEHILVEDARVHIRFRPYPTIRVARGEVRVHHAGAADGSADGTADARPTEVDVADVYAVARFPDRGMIDNTPIRAAGSIFDLATRICHRRDTLAMRIQIGPSGNIALTYENASVITRVALGFTRMISGISLHPGRVDLRGVPEC